MIKLAHVAGFGFLFIVIAYPVYGILIDIGMYVYETGLLQYPPSITPVLVFIYNTVYPNLGIICAGGILLFAISYGLYKRYT